MTIDRILVPLADVVPQPPRWLWPDRIPLGALSILEGDPAQAKSSVMYDLAARVTKGDPMPEGGRGSNPAGVILLQGEDSMGKIKPALEAAGADLARIRVYDRQRFTRQPFRLPEDISLLRETIEQVQAKLVVIDPLGSFVGINLNSEQQVRWLVGPLQTFAETAEVAVVIVRHLTKSQNTHSMYRGSGSIGLTGAARVTLQAVSDPDGNDPHRHLLVQIKNNWGHAKTLAYRTVAVGDTICVEWLGPSRYTSQDIFAGGREDLSRKEEAAYVLYLLLRHGPRWSTDIQRLARQADVAWRTVLRAKKDLGIRSRRLVNATSARCAWVLPQNATVLRPHVDRLIRETLEQMCDDNQLSPGMLPQGMGPWDDDADNGNPNDAAEDVETV